MNFKKLMSLMLAFVMLLAVVAPTAQVFAAQEQHKTTVVIHKMKMSSLEGFPLKQKEGQNHIIGKDNKTQYDGNKIEDITGFFGEAATELAGVNFYVYKVDTKENYEKLVKNPENYETKEEVEKAEGVTKYNNGNAYVTTENGVDVENLEDGYYWFVEDKASTIKEGSITGAAAVPFGLALPIYKADGSMFDTNDKLHVYPKNTVNKVQFDKNFAKENGLEAITDKETLLKVGAVFENYEKQKANVKGQIGKEIPYEAKVSLPQGSTFKNLDLVDAMDKGLKYNATNGVKLEVTPETLSLKLTEHYKITPEANGFKLNFNAEGLKLINEAAKKEKVEITFKYSANVTADAVVDQPMDNHATIIFNHTPPKFESEEITTENGEITVTKNWANQGEKANTVKYVLLDKQGNPVADVTFTAARVVDKTDLGNGITFKVTGDFSGTFSGLQKDGTKYKVKEIVNGFEPKFNIQGNGVTITNTKTPNSITPTPPQVTVGGKKFVKTNSDGKERLAGAEFIIKNLNGGTDENKFLKVTPVESRDYEAAKSAYDEAIAKVNEALAKGEISKDNSVVIGEKTLDTKEAALAEIKTLYNKMQEEFVKANLNYEWVDQGQATKFYTDGEGRFEVKGLAYGNYQAVETAAPKGYALPTGGGNFTFEVKDGSYTKDGQINYDKEKTESKNAMQIKNNKVTIPQTGGIGTVIFTVAGLAIMGGAFYVMKKNNEEEEA